MLILILFAFLAGVVTILSPCILPILPIVLTGSVTEGKRRPFGVVAGFIVSFTFFTLALATIVKATGLSADALRTFAIVVIGGLGVSLLFPQTQLWLEQIFTRFASAGPRLKDSDGFWGGLLVGLSLGLVWAPCVGPILAAVITLAVSSQINLGTVFITLAYSVGTAIPMLLIMWGGRALLARVPWLFAKAALIQRAFGIVMIGVAVAMVLNFDRSFQTWVLTTFPEYGTGLTKIEDVAVVNQQLEKLRGGTTPKSSVTLSNPRASQTAPEFTKTGAWLNSPPLTMAELKGKVVLIDFWTYSCINCIRTLPYLRAWHATYADQGLVIVGVHTPEFEFEKNLTNVTKAVKDFGLLYPIVQDNEFGTWNAYNNRYWPAKYLIDAEGRIRYHHYGEGEYEATETAIRELLNEAGMPVATQSGMAETPAPVSRRQTPETYLGYERAQSFMNSREFKRDQVVEYQAQPPQSDAWTLDGAWMLTSEYAQAQASDTSTRLQLNFNAKDVYLVMGNDQPAQVKVTVNNQRQWLGKDVSADGTVTVGAPQLYHLVAAPQVVRDGVLELTVPAGTKLFAFTFGS